MEEALTVGLDFNATIKLDEASGMGGLYRIVFVDRRADEIALARLNPPTADEKPSRGGRHKLEQTRKARKKPPAPLVGKLIWGEFEKIESLIHTRHLGRIVEIESDRVGPPVVVEAESDHVDGSTAPLTRKQKIYRDRCDAMQPFLDHDNFKTEVRAARGISTLVQAACERSGLSAPAIYKYFSLLCRYGFTELSLVDRTDRSGAPGVARRVDPDTAKRKGRKKAGRKTNKQRTAKLTEGIDLPPEQPGMSTEWVNMIMAADAGIPCPKPPNPRRCQMIIEAAFVTTYKDVDGNYIPVNPAQGAYPSPSQIRRVLEESKPRLMRLLESTTKGHFKRSMRSMTGKSKQDIAGPGHTWAVDSTIADIYLRSTVNRAWVIGRPVVYTFVDLWSTAIVGFLVCLEGPKWAMAKQGIFSCVARPALMDSIRGFEAMNTLSPYPTLPVYLMCDRGEYLSKGASGTALKLKLSMQYAPPYRPDLKGLVEVLHRIQKDQQFLFAPGTIDARRRELELRKFDMRQSAMTLPQYVRYLSICFAKYNLIADRTSHLDAEMISVGVYPSPAGLWRYGFEVGMGTRRAMMESDLIRTLLPVTEAKVTRHGLMAGGLEYVSPIANELQWTGIARNFGSWKMDAHRYTGSVSRIWTAHPLERGMMELQLSDYARATPQNSWDEVVDAFAYRTLSNHDRMHEAMMTSLDLNRQAKAIIDSAVALTKEADSANNTPSPSTSEARSMESAGAARPDAPGATRDTSDDDASNGLFDTQDDLAEKLFKMMNMEEFHDGV